MPLELIAGTPGFAAGFNRLVASARETVEQVDSVAAAIVEDVRRRRDQALLDYTARFDKLEVTADRLAIGSREIDAAWRKTPAAARRALQTAAQRIDAFHRRQLPGDVGWTDGLGLRLGWRWTAVDSVGLYVPGGRAAYPSSVLMNAVPARVAGVERLVMVVPTPSGVLNPLVLAAARIAGVTEIYRVGGAQAVAALAFGTATIKAVDKIVGPGNAYVAAAKRLVFGTVGIDSIAGPSEVVVVADAANDPDWIAADLMAQAEHDPVAQSILITDDARFAARVGAAVDALIGKLKRKAIAAASWRDHGAVIVVRRLADAPALVDRLAPEHLQLAVAEPDRLAGRIRHAGAIFLGRHTPEALGDYVAGPSHVLPTSRTARFASGLGVLDFMKRTTLIGADSAGLDALAPAAVALARAEGLDAHARSIAVRRAARR
ncbi:MAG: histidinol dehydrogenase [Phreatobacter sp.]|uniref:histidinol dehydrogenase n=1 Tax=Phreatobacter sp. TaxID=1966341 RepID=UPI001A36F18E|nr:histidinol dehydrogenase [Phreatobacter sp.]MBL8571812.1 histidinol dehydrogenase [Phreatobacter sp.]